MGSEADRKFLSRSEMKNEWSCTFTPAYYFAFCSGMTLVFIYPYVEPYRCVIIIIIFYLKLALSAYR